jgi:hypothetical protein
MNRIAISFVLCALAFAANAQTADSNQKQAVSAGVTVVTGDKARIEDRNCLRETGSHISSKHRDACVNAPGRAYTRADIDRTGTSTLADALRHLDPAVTVRGH